MGSRSFSVVIALALSFLVELVAPVGARADAPRLEVSSEEASSLGDPSLEVSRAEPERMRHRAPLAGPIVLTVTAGINTGFGIVASAIALSLDFCESSNPWSFCGSREIAPLTAIIIGATSLSLAGTISSAVWWGVNDRARRRSHDGLQALSVAPIVELAPGAEAGATTLGLSLAGAW